MDEKADPKKAAAMSQAMAVYACTLCRKTFKESGMCPDCDRVLKKGAG